MALMPLRRKGGERLPRITGAVRQPGRPGISVPPVMQIHDEYDLLCGNIMAEPTLRPRTICDLGLLNLE